jgi:hypothetical protein
VVEVEDIIAAPVNGITRRFRWRWRKHPAGPGLEQVEQEIHHQ